VVAYENDGAGSALGLSGVEVMVGAADCTAPLPGENSAATASSSAAITVLVRNLLI
jgi:hypothetical protein